MWDPNGLGSPDPPAFLAAAYMACLLDWFFSLSVAFLGRHSMVMVSVTFWDCHCIFRFILTAFNVAFSVATL
jgi:hypothetical protein